MCFVNELNNGFLYVNSEYGALGPSGIQRNNTVCTTTNNEKRIWAIITFKIPKNK